MTTAASMQQLANAKPRLAAGVVRQDAVIRGEPWVLLQNTINGEHIRLNATASQWLDAFDGETTVAKLLVNAKADENTAREVFQYLFSLGQANMIELGDADEHARVFQQHLSENKTDKQRKRNPLAIRIPLLNPDAWLESTQSRWSHLFNKRLSIAAIVIVLLALMLAFVHASSLHTSWTNLTVSPAHWWWYALIYPVLKVWHEFAHAVCIKRWGGEVHEAGITLLVLMPIPYIDASDSWAFEKRSQRLITAAAGIVAESVAVAIALIVWTIVEPGLIRELAFAIMVLGTASTVLFNANPLLRFDGYYILQDLIDMPNLGARSGAYYRYLVRRYALDVKTAVTPSTAEGERRWLLAYGASSFIYRVFITIVIALFLAKQYFFIGFALAGYAIYQLLAKPATRAIQYLRYSAEIESFRSAAISKSAITAAVVVITIAFLPLPSSTRAQGVVWVPSQAQVFAGATGLLEQQHVQAGEKVKAGDLLFTLSSPKLNAEYQSAMSEAASVKIEYQAATTRSIDEAKQLSVDLESLEAKAAVLGKRQDALEIRAQRSGVLALSGMKPLLGSHVKQGDLLAFLVDNSQLVVRAVVDQAAKGRVDEGVTQSTVRLADNFADPLDSVVIQQIPAGNHQLPSPSLAYNGHSGIAVASSPGEELRTTERVFHVELSLPSESNAVGIGGRAYVSLQHEAESLGQRWWRSARQLLLKQLTV